MLQSMNRWVESSLANSKHHKTLLATSKNKIVKAERIKKETASSDPQDRKVRSNKHNRKNGSDPQDRFDNIRATYQFGKRWSHDDGLTWRLAGRTAREIISLEVAKRICYLVIQCWGSWKHSLSVCYDLRHQLISHPRTGFMWTAVLCSFYMTRDLLQGPLMRRHYWKCDGDEVIDADGSLREQLSKLISSGYSADREIKPTIDVWIDYGSSERAITPIAETSRNYHTVSSQNASVNSNFDSDDALSI